MMTRIKIEDLPVKEEIQEEELKGVFGGIAIIARRQQKVRGASSRVQKVRTPLGRLQDPGNYFNSSPW